MMTLQALWGSAASLPIRSTGGLPNLSFTNFASLQDINPQLLRNQTYTFTDNVVWTHGKHSWRWGGDFRRIQLNTETSSNARGSFIFTGINTGYDFADFLYDGQLNGQSAYGLPQQTSVQFGENNYHFHGNYWDLYVQDEWKLRGNLTLNLGVRYEFVSPLTEEGKRIANLDLSPAVLNPALGIPTVEIVLPGRWDPTVAACQPACFALTATTSLRASALPGSLSPKPLSAADMGSTTTRGSIRVLRVSFRRRYRSP